MGLVDGKVALVTGAGRGQGRSHAVRLAAEGADVIAVDICADRLETLSYALATQEDLDTTISEVEATGRRAVKAIADVRSLSEMQAAVETGLAELGKIDIVCANAGIGSWAVVWEMTEQQWQEMIDINLTGVFNTVRAALPSMVQRGQGGSLDVRGPGGRAEQPRRQRREGVDEERAPEPGRLAALVEEARPLRDPHEGGERVEENR